MTEPAYLFIAREYEQRIRSGTLPPGTRLPSPDELAARHSTSETMARKAIYLLRSQGLVRTVRLRGTFVTDHLAERHIEKSPNCLDTAEPNVTRFGDDIDRLLEIASPIQRAQAATELIINYQLRVAELSAVRQQAIEDAHRAGMNIIEIGEHLGLAKDRISQLGRSNP